MKYPDIKSKVVESLIGVVEAFLFHLAKWPFVITVVGSPNDDFPTEAGKPVITKPATQLGIETYLVDTKALGVEDNMKRVKLQPNKVMIRVGFHMANTRLIMRKVACIDLLKQSAGRSLRVLAMPLN